MRHFVRIIACRLFFFIALIESSLPAMAGNTIHVPANQPTIQAGINAAINGDTVLVSPGTYFENINFNGKAITVASADGPTGAIIDGNQAGATVTFATNETLKSVLRGFTIRNASTSGIYISGSSPTIRKNIIAGNAACGGSGISIYLGSPSISQNVIAGNGSPSCSFYGYAGIVSSDDTGVTITGNLISANSGTAISLYPFSGSEMVVQNTIINNTGGGFFVYGQNGSTATLTQNLITGNQGTGVSWVNPPVTLVSNTMSGNLAGCCGSSASEIYGSVVDTTVVLQNNLAIATGSNPAFYCSYLSSSPTLGNNDIFAANNSAYNGACPDETGTNGNISVDPLFADALSDNFHLQSGSPAIAAGTPSALHEPKTDFDGDPRLTAGKIDIGADEYSSHPTLSTSAYAFHFAAQNVGTTSVPQTVTVTNNGTTSVQLPLIATGSNYSQTSNCGKTLAPGANCQISVSFAPIVGGTVGGVLGIFSSATQNPLAVGLVGTGLAPKIQIGCCFYFFTQVIGTTNTQTQTVTNIGQAPLLISNIVYSGPTDFVETNNCPISPNTLAVGASCTLTASFTPTLVGNESGTITVTSNGGAPQTINLNGSSVSAGKPVLSPTSLTFPTTLIGQSSASQTATLTNAGSGPMAITNIFSNADFPVSNNCPSSLAVNASCTLTVTYTPTVPGIESGSVSVYTDSLTYYVNLSVTGTGQSPAPAISSLSLASVPAGSGDTQITITGTGFVYDSQVLWNGVALGGYNNVYGGTQITATIPATDLANPVRTQLSVFTPAPGGGTSNALPFIVYAPINYAEQSTTYSYRTITGANLNLSYAGSALITPPFPIQFGGGSYSVLTVSASGTISFNGFASVFNTVIPTSQTTTLIAPFWLQFYPFGSGTNNNAFWQVTGTAPNRELVVEWRNLGICCETTNTVKFQVVFFEGNSNILFNYADTIFGGAYSSNDNGATATAGVQVASTLGTQFSYYQPLLLSKTAQLWYPSSPTATLSTGTIGFGYHQIGNATLPQAVTLTNGGLVPLNISSLTTDNPDFTQTNTCGSTVPPAASCTIQVTFKPTQPLAETATLTIVDNGSNSPQTVALTGIGTVSSTVVYPVLVNFGGVTVGNTGTAPVTLANASNKTMTIQSIAAAPSVYTETNNCGSSLAPGLSCTINVTFKPAQKGSVPGTLSMGLNGKAARTEANLTGSGS
jgi:hypothetical protein